MSYFGNKSRDILFFIPMWQLLFLASPLYKKLAGSASEAPSSDDMMGSKLHLRGAKENILWHGPCPWSPEMRRGKSRTNLKYSGPCYYVGHSGTAHTASLYTLANKSYCVEGCVILLPSFPRLLFHPRNLRGGIHATLATITLLARMLLPFPMHTAVEGDPG